MCMLWNVVQCINTEVSCAVTGRLLNIAKGWQSWYCGKEGGEGTGFIRWSGLVCGMVGGGGGGAGLIDFHLGSL